MIFLTVVIYGVIKVANVLCLLAFYRYFVKGKFRLKMFETTRYYPCKKLKWKAKKWLKINLEYRDSRFCHLEKYYEEIKLKNTYVLATACF